MKPERIFASSNQRSCPDLKLPVLKNSLQIIHSDAFRDDNLTSALVTPSIRVSVSPRRSEEKPASLRSPRQQLPTSEQLREWQRCYRPDKKPVEDFSARKTWAEEPKEPGSPRVSVLRKLQAGVNPDALRFREVVSMPSSPKPVKCDSNDHLFPSYYSEYSRPTVKPPSSKDVDIDFANYVVSAQNAFNTVWSKHHSFKQREFFPAKHPEFSPGFARFNRPRDFEVEYREAILKVKATRK